jgi:hypothetical protein
VQLRPLHQPGRYRVDYRVAASDGHPVTGTYWFRITTVGSRALAVSSRSTSQTAPPLQRTVATAAAGPTSSTWLVGALGVGTLTALLATAGLRRRQQDAVTR